MKQREVTDNENTKWTCVQAFSMTGAKAAEKAEELVEKENGHVTVVCTPAGGARSVRLDLPPQWEDTFDDKELVEAIKKTQL